MDTFLRKVSATPAGASNTPLALSHDTLSSLIAIPFVEQDNGGGARLLCTSSRSGQVLPNFILITTPDAAAHSTRYSPTGGPASGGGPANGTGGAPGYYGGP